MSVSSPMYLLKSTTRFILELFRGTLVTSVSESSVRRGVAYSDLLGYCTMCKLFLFLNITAKRGTSSSSSS